MAVSSDVVGKTYPAVTYVVGRETLREYSAAVGESDQVHHDPEVARSAGYADVVAPRMFAVVYCGPAITPPLFDPEVGIDFAHMVHGAQEFTWEAPVVAGDEISTEVSVKDVSERGGMGFYVFESRSVNQRDELVCAGTWTNIVRGSGND